MRTVPFGSTGLTTGVLGFGGASLASGSTDIPRAVRAVELLLDAGVNLIDTAACYGDSEEIIGRHLARHRDRFILVSKCGHHEVLPDGSMRSLPVTMDDIDRALRRLRTDRIDVMLLHSYDRGPLVEGEARRVLAGAIRAGKIRFAGYSGDNETAVLAAGFPEISVVETSVNLCDQANLRGVVARGADHGTAIMAKRSVANAAWIHRHSPPSRFAGLHARPYIERFQAM